MDALVSIIIPVYNVLPYINEAIDSVLCQSYKNLDIIIIDDGSTDGSGKMCDQYSKDPRVTVVHQMNRGLSGARNTGLELIKGDYIAFLDSDDVMDHEMIDTLVKAIDEAHADIAICAIEPYTGEKNKMNKSGVESILTSSEAQNMLISGKIQYTVWNKLYKRSLWNNIGFPDGHVHEDMLVSCLILEKCKKIVSVSQPLIRYRNRIGSISNTYSAKNTKDYLFAFKTLEEYIYRHEKDIFDFESISDFREINAMTMCYRYIMMYCMKEEFDEIDKIRKEALHQWEMLERETISLKSKTIYYMLKYSPHILIYMNKVREFIKYAKT